MTIKTAFPPKSRIFTGDFPTFANFITPTGVTVGFYQGYLETTDPLICEYVLTLPTVSEVTDTKDLKVPKVPERSRGRNWASASSPDPMNITPVELLQRAVASSASLPQAAESTSTS